MTCRVTSRMCAEAGVSGSWWEIRRQPIWSPSRSLAMISPTTASRSSSETVPYGVGLVAFRRKYCVLGPSFAAKRVRKRLQPSEKRDGEVLGYIGACAPRGRGGPQPCMSTRVARSGHPRGMDVDQNRDDLGDLAPYAFWRSRQSSWCQGVEPDHSSIGKLD